MAARMASRRATRTVALFLGAPFFEQILKNVVFMRLLVLQDLEKIEINIFDILFMSY